MLPVKVLLLQFLFAIGSLESRITSISPESSSSDLILLNQRPAPLSPLSPLLAASSSSQSPASESESESEAATETTNFNQLGKIEMKIYFSISF